jgi:hypothetical protein
VTPGLKNEPQPNLSPPAKAFRVGSFTVGSMRDGPRVNLRGGRGILSIYMTTKIEPGYGWQLVTDAWKHHDQYWNGVAWSEFATSVSSTKPYEEVRRRRIDPGEGWEIVGIDETFSSEDEAQIFRYGQWEKNCTWTSAFTPRQIIAQEFCNDIAAIRRRKSAPADCMPLSLADELAMEERRERSAAASVRGVMPGQLINDKREWTANDASAQPACSWVKTSERLPEVDKQVPVRWLDGTYTVAWFTRFDEWHCKDGKLEQIPDYWLDAPEPPKPEPPPDPAYVAWERLPENLKRDLSPGEYFANGFREGQSHSGSHSLGATIHSLIRERDEARADAERLGGSVTVMTRQRNEALADVGHLKDRLNRIAELIRCNPGVGVDTLSLLTSIVAERKQFSIERDYSRRTCHQCLHILEHGAGMSNAEYAAAVKTAIADIRKALQ